MPFAGIGEFMGAVSGLVIMWIVAQQPKSLAGNHKIIIQYQC
jgi:hypothetical protein